MRHLGDICATLRYEAGIGDISQGLYDAAHEAADAIESLQDWLKEADSAWCDAVILVTHPDPDRQWLAKQCLYAWRDKVKEALS
jgi:hypothetical protein